MIASSIEVKQIYASIITHLLIILFQWLFVINIIIQKFFN